MLYINNKTSCEHHVHSEHPAQAYEAEAAGLLELLLLLEAVLRDDVHLVPLPDHPGPIVPGQSSR